MLLFALAHRDHAAVRDFADYVLELDRGVVDVEVVVEAVFHVVQNALAYGRWNVDNRDVAGERTSLRPYTPAVEIVHVVDSFDRADRGLDFLQAHPPGRAFEQNIQRLAHDAVARPQDQRADAEGERGIDPIISRDKNRPASEDYGGGGERIADFVQQGTADVHVGARVAAGTRSRPPQH